MAGTETAESRIPTPIRSVLVVALIYVFLVGVSMGGLVSLRLAQIECPCRQGRQDSEPTPRHEAE